MTAPRVFISYSHDSDDHKQRVLELANRLREGGIDAWVDRYSAPPPEGWAHWIEHQIEAARWIIIVCTETYRRRFDLKEEGGKGRGVAYEAMLTRADLYDAAGRNFKVIPILFSDNDAQHIPRPFGSSSRYVLPAGYDGLIRHIAGAPEVEPPPLGEPAQAVEQEAAKLHLPEVQSAGAPDECLQREDSDPGQPRPARVPGKRSRPKQKRLLIVAANPKNTKRLALGREIREICLTLRRASAAGYDVRVLSAATARDLRQEMLEVKPQILHFCGHGGRAGIVLEQEDGHETEMMDGGIFADWLKVAIAGQRHPLELALLNFCDSHQMLNALADVADVVVGPTRLVGDSQAVMFSSAFYLGLAHGCTGAFSYHLGCAATEMSASSLRERLHPYGIRCRSTTEEALAGAISGRRAARLTLAVFASEPPTTPQIRLDRELRAIYAVLRGKAVCIEQRWATRVSDFLQTLLETRPAIVHLTGHGGEDGEFVFETNHDSDHCPAPSQAMAKVLALFHGDIRCAVLLFNNSSRLAEHVVNVLDYVISIRGAVSDKTCLAFTEAFYQMIGHDGTIPQAYEAAVLLLRSRPDVACFSLQGRAVPRSAALCL